MDKNSEIVTKTPLNVNKDTANWVPENLPNSPSPDSVRKSCKETQPTIYPEIDYVNRTLP